MILVSRILITLRPNMKTTTCISDRVLYFSRWSGKGYAIFAALGKQVQIAGLALHICWSALLKSARKGVIVNDAAVWEEIEGRKAENRLLEILDVCLRQGEVCPVDYKIVKQIEKGMPVRACPFLVGK